jgi:hypothetical protein
MTDRKTKIPAIPAVPPKVDPQLKPLLNAVKEALEVRVGHRGDSLDKAVTFRDLTDSGMVTVPVGAIASGSSITVNSSTGDLSTPPVPRDLTAAPTFSHVTLVWEGGYKHPLVSVTEIFRHTSDDLDDAVQIDAVPNGSKMYTDTVDPGSTHYYWVRFRSPAGVPGPFNATNGVVGTTSKKISTLIAELSDELGATSLSTTLRSTINSTFRQTSAPSTKNDGTALVAGDVWYDTSNNNILYRFDGSSWVNTQDGSFTTAAAVDTKIIEQVGYCELTASTGDKSVATGLTTKTACEAATPPSGGSYSWNDSGAIAGEVKTVTSTADGHTSTIQIQTDSIDGIEAQYTVKIDQDGHVAGFGLASSLPTDTYDSSGNPVGSFSEFQINADAFRITKPDGSGISPFTVSTGAGLCVLNDGSVVTNCSESTCYAHTDSNGDPDWKQWFESGVWMNTALIHEATIDWAHIKDVVIDAGELTGTINYSVLDGVTLIADEVSANISIEAPRITGTSEIIGGTISGSTITGSLILTTASAKATEYGTPHYGYDLGVSDSSSNSTTNDIVSTANAIKPYNYQYTTAPTNNQADSSSNLFRYRRESITPSIDGYFQLSGDTSKYWAKTTPSTLFFTIDLSVHSGTPSSSNELFSKSLSVTISCSENSTTGNLTKTVTGTDNGCTFQIDVPYVVQYYRTDQWSGSNEYWVEGGVDIPWSIDCSSGFDYDESASTGIHVKADVSYTVKAVDLSYIHIEDVAENDY